MERTENIMETIGIPCFPKAALTGTVFAGGVKL